ncbi:DUF4185 domain-containing protein [Nocardia tengchongensis]|uniref:DUF4185 domain-containing protein n=1 Tax=Nocardia tengchongensis TaxID=2055889 RepID=UPI003654DC6D
MGIRSRRRSNHAEIPAALSLSAVVMLGAMLLPATTAAAAPHPWAPAPVNSCGETGFDPVNRQADPSGSTSQAPVTVKVPIPVPQIVTVQQFAPKPDQNRVDVDLPADPCASPCPDVRDTVAPTPPAAPGGGSASLPQVEVTTEAEPIPVVVPGGEPPEPQPAPAAAPLQQAVPAPPAAAVAAPQVDSVELVNQVTGHGSINRTDTRWSVDGTDLGLMWESKPGQVAVVFGDTFGKGWKVGGAGTDTQDWRSNVIAYSSTRDLSQGLVLDDFVQNKRCHAAEILDSRKVKNFETTTIPTSGFAVGDRQYLTYMSVNRWSKIPGMWWTNLGGIAWSDDNGRTWTKSQWARWDNLFGLGRFQVATMVPHGDYVYMFGTPNGRLGTIGLARVPTDHILDKSSYQYWVNDAWVPADGANELLATPLISGTASELSVHFDAESNRWQLVYLDTVRQQIVLRTASDPQGTWTEPVALINTEDYPTAYGGFIHPWSTGKDLYFTISAWNSYNVYLMHAKLK